VAIYSRPWAGHERALEALAASLTAGGVRELRLRVVSDEVFSLHAHDRHLRVDRTVVQLGKGIEVLAGQQVVGASDFDLKPASAFTRVREAHLRQACKELRWAREGADGGLVRRR
jgi:putative methionine-R-sulfoxide reductase with GAF domain